MKLFSLLFSKNKKKRGLSEYSETIRRVGRDQIRELAKKGLAIPIVVL